MIVRWRWIIGIAAVLSGSFLLYYMLREREVAISVDEDWDALVMAAGVVSSFFLALVLFILNNAESQRIRSLRHAHEEANAEKNRFLRRLDHEMKNPLTAIQAALANLESQSYDPDIQNVYQTINSQSQRLSHLVRDLRLVTDLDKQDFQPQSIQIADLFAELELLVQDELSAKGQKLSLSLSPNLPSIQGDYDLLLAALYNLLTNAMKYTGENGSIELSATYDAKNCLINVRDNGMGIPAAELPFVWDELFRSETVREIAGSGIGLALVRNIIDKHQGTVAIKSSLGKGTSVTVQIPIQHVSEL